VEEVMEGSLEGSVEGVVEGQGPVEEVVEGSVEDCSFVEGAEGKMSVGGSGEEDALTGLGSDDGMTEGPLLSALSITSTFCTDFIRGALRGRFSGSSNLIKLTILSISSCTV